MLRVQDKTAQTRQTVQTLQTAQILLVSPKGEWLIVGTVLDYAGRVGQEGSSGHSRELLNQMHPPDGSGDAQRRLQTPQMRPQA